MSELRLSPLLLALWTIAACIPAAEPADEPPSSSSNASMEDATVAPEATTIPIEVIELPVGTEPAPTTIVGADPDDAAMWKRVMGSIEAGGYLGIAEEELLRAHPNKARAGLRGIVERLTPEHRRRSVRIVRWLVELGDPWGRWRLGELLRDDDPEIRAAALRAARWAFEEILPSEEETELLLSRLEDPDPEVRGRAVQTCGALELPGVVTRFRALLDRPDPPAPARLAYWIGKHGSPEIAIPRLARFVTDRPDEASWALGRLADWGRELEPPHSDLAVKAVEDFFEGELVEDGFGSLGQGHFDQTLVRHLTAVATERSLPALERILREARDPVSRGEALVAIARLRGGAALALLEETAADPPASYYWVRAVEKAIEAETSPDLEARLRELPVRHLEELAMDHHTVRLLARECGEPGRRALAEHLDRIHPEDRQWLVWELRGWTLETVLADARGRGLLPEPIPEGWAEDFRRRHREEWGIEDTSDAELLVHALVDLGVLFAFDAESDVIPSPHDELIRGFGTVTHGRFVPRHIRQTPEPSGEAGPAEETPYRIEFVIGDKTARKLYRFQARNYRDWYDVEAVHEALNFALADQERPERYFAWNREGQVAYFLFGPVQVVESFAADYALPVDGGTSEARRLGQEYERHVIEAPCGG